MSFQDDLSATAATRGRDGSDSYGSGRRSIRSPSVTVRSASPINASASPPLLERTTARREPSESTEDSRTARRHRPRARYRAACGGSKPARPERARMVPDRRSGDAAGSPTPDSCRREARVAASSRRRRRTLRRCRACSTARAGSPLGGVCNTWPRHRNNRRPHRAKCERLYAEKRVVCRPYADHERKTRTPQYASASWSILRPQNVVICRALL